LFGGGSVLQPLAVFPHTLGPFFLGHARLVDLGTACAGTEPRPANTLSQEELIASFSFTLENWYHVPERLTIHVMPFDLIENEFADRRYYRADLIWPLVNKRIVVVLKSGVAVNVHGEVSTKPAEEFGTRYGQGGVLQWVREPGEHTGNVRLIFGRQRFQRGALQVAAAFHVGFVCTNPIQAERHKTFKAMTVICVDVRNDRFPYPAFPVLMSA
jgi:hypothetical protein